jgi:class 3 adenylate cyclase
MRQEQQDTSENISEQDKAKNAVEIVRQRNAAQENTVPLSQEYNTDTAARIIALAGRLQSQKIETMSIAQIEALATEVGVDPRYIQEAILATQEKNIAGSDLSSTLSPKSARFTIPSLLWWSIAWIVIPIIPIIVSIFNLDWRNYLWSAVILFFYIATGVTLSLKEEKNAKRENVGMSKSLIWWVSGWLPIAIVPLYVLVNKIQDINYVWTIIPVFGYIATGIVLSFLEKQKREQEKPSMVQKKSSMVSAQNAQLKSGSGVSRQELLAQLFTLQEELEAATVHRAFLSIDVVGSSEMKKNNTNLAIEYSFGEYQLWVKQIVESQNGKFQSAAGDGVMCVFTNDQDAIRAGNLLLEDLPRFNATQNKCNTPFKIRCGVNAGEVVMDESGSIGSLQSSVLDYAAALQKQAAPNSLALSESLSVS